METFSYRNTPLLHLVRHIQFVLDFFHILERKLPICSKHSTREVHIFLNIQCDPSKLPWDKKLCLQSSQLNSSSVRIQSNLKVYPLTYKVCPFLLQTGIKLKASSFGRKVKSKRYKIPSPVSVKSTEFTKIKLT